MREPLRILQTLDAAGGVWRYALDLARSLRPLGFETAFLGFGPEPSPGQRAEAERLGPLDWSPLPLDWMAGEATAVAGVPAAVAEAAKRQRADLLHLNLPSQAAGLAADLPILVVSHSCTATWFRAVKGSGLPPDWAWQGTLNARGFAAADLVVAPSRSHAEALCASYGAPPSLQVVPNATSAPEGEPGGESFVIASGRWWDEGKGGAVIDAAAGRSDWPVRLLGATTGGQGQAFRPAHATVLGERPHAEAVALTRRAGIFASPSLYEPFGLAVAEAARMGLPLILSDINTFRELWEGAALLVPPGDAQALSDALNRLAGDPTERRRLGALARERSRRFTPEAQARAMLAIYRDLLARPQGMKAAS